MIFFFPKKKSMMSANFTLFYHLFDISQSKGEAEEKFLSIYRIYWFFSKFTENHRDSLLIFLVFFMSDSEKGKKVRPALFHFLKDVLLEEHHNVCVIFVKWALFDEKL